MGDEGLETKLENLAKTGAKPKAPTTAVASAVALYPISKELAGQILEAESVHDQSDVPGNSPSSAPTDTSVIESPTILHHWYSMDAVGREHATETVEALTTLKPADCWQVLAFACQLAQGRSLAEAKNVVVSGLHQTRQAIRAAVLGKDETHWQCATELDLYAILQLNESAQPIRWTGLIHELQKQEVKMLADKDEYTVLLIPIRIQLPDLPSYVNVFRLTGHCHVELAQMSYRIVIDPSN